jgi:hypothetical protein
MPAPDALHDFDQSPEPLKTNRQGEKRYPLLYFYPTVSWWAGLIVLCLIIGASGIFFVWYDHPGNNIAPGDPVGLGYAFAGTFFFLLAAIMYSLRRRARKRSVGQLHAALNWHVFFAVIGVALLFMHSFGNFNPISGTYAFMGLLALSISGLVGRMLDRVLPRLIAKEVNKVLTAQGDDRIELVSQKLQSIVVHNTQELQGFPTQALQLVSPPSQPDYSRQTRSLSVIAEPSKPDVPWDLAYISLERTQQELDHDAPHYRFIPDKKSPLTRPEMLMPGTNNPLIEIREMQQALRREQRYRYIIRYWRIFHICLVFVTIGLVIWHIIFATMLLLPGLFH